MNHYRLSQRAENDLEDLWVYIAQNDPIAADLQVAQLLDRFPMLAQFSNLGQQRDDLLVGLRSFPIKPYLIFYRSIPKGVEIVRILHQSRNIKSQFP